MNELLAVGRPMREAKLYISPKVSLKLHNFERFDDDSGYRMKVDFVSDPLSCVGKDLYFEDFDSVVECLAKAHKDLSGSVSFKMPFEDDSLSIEYNGKGGVIVSGLFYTFGTELQKAQLCFSTDQSYMSNFVSEVKAIYNDLHS